MESNTQTSAAPPRANYFLSVNFCNIRCFGPETQTLSLSNRDGSPARWTILLGENGAGKTTVLQVIAGVQGIPHQPADPDEYYDAPRFLGYAQTGDSMSLLREPSIDAVVRARISSCERIECGMGGRPTAECGFALNSMSFRILGFHMLPPICYGYGAARRPGAASISEDDRADPAATLYRDHASMRSAEEWLLRADYSASKPSAVQERQQARLEQAKELLTSILPGVSEIRFTQPTGTRPIPAVEFKTHYGWVSIKSLGYGYQTMIGWTVDLASRLVERYPDSANPLAERAVVLVDEIDLHLHPAWQRQLIDHLTRVFANTQFIVTAHSPLIVQGATNANIAVLRRDGDHVVIDNEVESIRGWRVDQILTSDLFDLPSARPPDLDEKLRRRIELLGQPVLTDADKREVEKLDTEIGDLPSGESSDDARRMLKLAEQTRDLLQKYGG